MSNKYVQYCNTFDETNIKSKEFVHTWKINNFQAYNFGKQYFRLSTKGMMNGKKLWCLNLIQDTEAQYVLFNLRFFIDEDNKNETISTPISYSIYLVDRNNEEQEIYKGDVKSVLPYIKLVEISYLFNKTNGVLPNGNLILRVKLYYPCEVIESCDNYRSCESNPKPSGHEQIFNKEKFSDVKIVVGDKVFWAYKGLLAIESPVFASMFEHDMQENNENTVTITDIDSKVIYEMLRFVYVGKVNSIENIARDLLIAADKYAIEDLKILCEQTLIDELSIETVVSLLAVANEYGANFLKDSALDYFKLHAKEIVQNEQCKEEFNSLMPLLSEIISSLVL